MADPIAAAGIVNAGLPPGVPADDYADFVNATRKQQLAQALMQSSLTAPTVDSPMPVKGVYVQPRVGALQGASKIVEALLGRQATNQAIGAQSDLLTKLNQAYAPTLPDGTPNPRNPMGLPADAARQLAMSNPTEYAKAVQGPEAVQLAQRSGQNPSQAAGAALAKSTQTLVRPNETAVANGPNGPTPQFTAPGDGTNVTWQNGQPTAAPIPGADVAARTAAAAKAAGSSSQQPIKLGVDANGRELYGFPSPPAGLPPPAAAPGAAAAPNAPGAANAPPAAAAPPALNATAPGAPASPGQVASQQKGGELGQDYAHELALNATGATEVRRSLSELTNLASQSTPDANNKAKLSLGRYMIAAGADPTHVGAFLGVDVGALEAGSKQTATLAVNTIHSMTSRGTNFDLETFMQNNPNLNMATPEGFARVTQYMQSKASAEIAKQADFTAWKKGDGRTVAPQDWETEHTAHWLAKQNADIDAGKSNSTGLAPPKGATVDQLPPAAQFRGRSIKDTQTGQVLISDGTTWKPKGP